MKKFIPLIFLSLALIMSACSGESETQEGTSSEDQGMEMTEGRTIEIYGINQMKYVVKEKTEGIQVGDSIMVDNEWYYQLTGINATPGEQLNVKLTTISQLPPSAMSHNWALLTKDTDVEAFNTASIKAKDNDYVAPEMEDQVIIETGMLGGGESKTISFNAPEETGDYTYLCTFPGHYLGGMTGTLAVTDEEMSESDM